MSPSSISQSPQLGAGIHGMGAAASQNGGGGDIQRLREELLTQKMKLAQWEDGITQARNVSICCELYVLFRRLNYIDRCLRVVMIL